MIQVGATGIEEEEVEEEEEEEGCTGLGEHHRALFVETTPALN
jgi:hypothetical protein